MGRPEKPLPVDGANPGHLMLAAHLRRWRKQAGLTYTQLAQRCTELHAADYSASTLRRAASGDAIPRLPVVEAYAEACGASASVARKYWRDARALDHPNPHQGGKTVPKAHLVGNSADLLAGLRHVYYRAGSMPLAEMESRAGFNRLPHSTLHRMLHGATMLTIDQLRAFLEVCEVPGPEEEAWVEAWRRVWQREQRHHLVMSRSARPHREAVPWNALGDLTADAAEVVRQRYHRDWAEYEEELRRMSHWGKSAQLVTLLKGFDPDVPAVIVHPAHAVEARPFLGKKRKSGRSRPRRRRAIK
ncbi:MULTISPECIES: helix-turn-helix domain-containing protein [unclassified Streptomyces]|uniref:helix-turn-helix domain-containing protein n=1 Tax=unclassified Streptomyces TaxID=2593676 RepID=UPI0036CC9C14